MSAQDDVRRAIQSLQYSHSPDWWMSTGKTFTLPLDAEDTGALYRAMNTRFRQWTGKDLRDYKP